MTTTSRFVATALAAIVLTALSPTASHAGHFALAFQRKMPAWENSAGPNCEPPNVGGRACRVWVWDENGNPMANIDLKTSWGVLMGRTDTKGRCEIAFSPDIAFDLVCIDTIGSTSDNARPMTAALDPCRERHSYEVGYLYKTSEDNPGSFDTNIECTWPEMEDYFTEAPYTKSLTYNGIDCNDYFSDLDSTWSRSTTMPPYFGQTFIATADRVVAARVQGTLGELYLLDWNLQILTFPGLVPVGPATSVPVEWPFGWEAYWGVNDNPVIPGRTYMLKVWRNGGMNIYHVPRDVYPHGEYYEGTTRIPGYDLNGHIVAMTYVPTGNLVALLELDESSGTTAEDNSGNEHHGTLYGDPTWQPGAGRTGGALQFDGIDDIVATIDF